jgi:NADH:ubiquinone oxidoreductase subunit 5 (subunit L)/multisubunit Na+/H+ antiporter MnhA subunit
LGLLGVSVSLGLLGLSFFHLLAHGLRKALLFISAGNFMFCNSHIQDLRGFSKISKKDTLRILKRILRIFSLRGGFFFSCYFSKDTLLETSLLKLKFFRIIILKFSIIFTFLYSFRLGIFFLKNFNKEFKFFFLKKKTFLRLKRFSSIPLRLSLIFFGKFFKNYILGKINPTKIFSLFV